MSDGEPSQRRCSRCASSAPSFARDERVVRAVDGVSFDVRPRRDRSASSASRAAEERHEPEHPAASCPPNGRIVSGERPARRHATSARFRSRDARRARPPHRDDLPGSDDEPEPVPARRRAARRDVRDSPGLSRGRSRGARARAPRSASAFPTRERRMRSYPHELSRRHAPARDDRHGAALRSRAPHRRRADDRARRDDPGADPGALARAPARARDSRSSSSRTTSASSRAPATACS